MNGEKTQGNEQAHLDTLEPKIELLLLRRQDGFIKWTDILDINRRLLSRLGF